MTYINSPIFAILCLAAFIWLAYASLHRQEQGYSVSVFSILDKPSLQQRQAKALKEIYGLTEADIAAPVVLWERQ